MSPRELAALYSQIESEKRRRHIAHVVTDHVAAEQVPPPKRKPRSISSKARTRGALASLLIAAAGIQAAHAQQASWLHPSDAQYAEAIKAGSTEKPKVKFKTVRFSEIQIPEETSNIEVVPPLACADRMASRAYSSLEPPPALADVKQLCDGTLGVNILHYSQGLNDNWPVVIEHGGTFRPTSSLLDSNPEVSTYHVLFGEATGYMYIDRYFFSLPAAWSDEATIVYADNGRHRKLKLECSKLVKEWSSH